MPSRSLALLASITAILLAAATATTAQDSDYYTNVSGHRVHRPVHSNHVPAGASARCRDGTYYGPLSSLAQRIQLAYAFNILSPGLMKDLDHLRATRNAISHSWDVSNLDGFLVDGRLGEMVRVDGILAERSAADEQLVRGLDAIGGFRVSLIWIMSRLVYEAAAYHRAKAANLHPQHALYDDPPPKWLHLVGEVALDASRQIANNG